ncbi:MAG: type II toxin-antitoxin system VapC family toxin [Deltaproteobacteria bacterium]|nr:type II toxin-antitoxin system VapC family toxin [Deltaproteobacteria bacterium]
MTRILLDTHVFLWWRLGGGDLSPAAVTAIRSADEVYVSVASAWEVAIKQSLGRVRLEADFEAGIADSQFAPLPIQFQHLRELAQLPPLHRDPIDRLLVAQARSERLVLVSRDPQVLAYDVARVVA